MTETGALYPIFEWVEATSLARVIRESLWLFPAIEALHLVALAVLGGAVLVVDLRLLGVGLADSTVTEIDRQARPWLSASVVILVVSGVLLFVSEAIKCYYNTAFWVKMITLPVAIVFTYAVRERFARRALYTSAYSRWVGVADLATWFIVAAGGRWIGFS